MPLMFSRLPALLLAVIFLSGCTAFSSVRSAEVYPGVSFNAQASLAAPPGEEAYWFWAFDCYRCNHSIPALDWGLAYGVTDREGARPFEMSAGINGLSPYLGGYVQLGQNERAVYGVGGRLGIPFRITWSTSQLYGRYDYLLSPGQRLLLNPGLMLHAGNSPNGENPGMFLGLVQGVGLEFEGAHVSLIPSASLVLGYGNRSSYGRREGPFTTAFGTASLAVSFHRRRSRVNPAPVPQVPQPGVPNQSAAGDSRPGILPP